MPLGFAVDAVGAAETTEAGPLPLMAFLTPTRLLLARSAIPVAQSEGCASSLVPGTVLVSAHWVRERRTRELNNW